MTKKQNTLCGVAGLIIGIIGGVAGTAFSMGAEKQKFQNALNTNNSQIMAIREQQIDHKADVGKEMDRYTSIVAGQITQLQSGVAELTTIVGNLRIDVQVLKAIMERMEKELKTR